MTTRQKLTAKDHEDRIEECVRLLRLRSHDGRPVTTGTIKKHFAKQYGAAPSTVLRYIHKASERIIVESGTCKATHQALTVEFLNSIIGDVSQKTADRLAANRQYMDLLGLIDNKQVATDSGTAPQQHIHLHAASPMNLEQRKQALRDRLGIGQTDRLSHHG